MEGFNSLNLKYCHDCALTQLQYELSLNGIESEIISDSIHQTFTIQDILVNVKNLSLLQNNKTFTFPDWNLFSMNLIHKLKKVN